MHRLEILQKLQELLSQCKLSEQGVSMDLVISFTDSNTKGELDVVRWNEKDQAFDSEF